jgi:hypothetical protein
MGVQANFSSLWVPKISPSRPSFSDYDVDYQAILDAFAGILITKKTLNDYLFEQGIIRYYWKRIRFYLWNTGLWEAHNGRVLNATYRAYRKPKKGKQGPNILSQIKTFDL